MHNFVPLTKLADKIRQLPSHGNEVFIDVQRDLLLLVAGEKLGIEWHVFGKSGPTEDVQPIPVEWTDEASAFLDNEEYLWSMLGPACIDDGKDNHRYRQRVVFRIARTSNYLDLEEQLWSDPSGYPTDSILHGRLSNFPTTAIGGFVSGNRMPVADLPVEVRISDACIFSRFSLSRDCWQEELKTGERWAAIIRDNAPWLYSSYRDMYFSWYPELLSQD